ncbi:VOC family protein [Flavobacterium litorale]|uniref:VOC family protein n=1 Tax=Flavobacterium litorale TaxID=2856519 RepID=A0ABX8V5N1_9FLAO|nr:VOC family protein [Flavobacterium litorale]QYJ68148.1 VOC family protein [Flavobacterium litorale]
MTQINPYIAFKGNCEEAFNFYKSVFGGEFTYISRFGEMPESDGYTVPEAEKAMIMHVSLPIGTTTLMGSDTPVAYRNNSIVGNNISVSFNTNSEKEAHDVFNGLAEGGNVLTPLAKTFWAPLFGMLTDKFGINWMINWEG